MEPADSRTKKEVSHGLLKILFGFLQILGATLTLIFFLKTGESLASYILAAATFTVTGISIFILRKR